MTPLLPLETYFNVNYVNKRVLTPLLPLETIMLIS